MDDKYDIEVLESLIKTLGGISIEKIKCGKANCKCTKGKLHGPYYYYRYYKVEGEKYVHKKKYLDKTTYRKLSSALKQYKKVRPFTNMFFLQDRQMIKLCLLNGDKSLNLGALDMYFPRVEHYTRARC